jgi:hypothetical protein
MLKEGFLTAWESQFVISIATRRGGVSPKQYMILKKLGDKVEAASKKQQVPSDPSPAA